MHILKYKVIQKIRWCKTYSTTHSIVDFIKLSLESIRD